MKHKKLLTILVILFILVVGFLIIMSQIHSGDDQVTTSTKGAENLCFYESDAIKGTIWMYANIKGGKVTGELRDLPIEKDSKIGTFSGTISNSDMAVGKTGIRIIDAIWKSRAEGVDNKEQLIIQIYDMQARIGFGEMVKDSNGVWLYKDPAKIPYFKSVSAVPCSEQWYRNSGILMD